MSDSKDTSRQNQRRPQRKRIDPALADIRDLTAYLATDIDTGLSPKVAEKRRLGREVKTLFAAEKPRLWDVIVPVLKEPVMWLLLIVGVMAWIFGREDVGLPVILLLLLHGLVCVLMGRVTVRMEGQMQAYDIPLASVLRKGRLLRISADYVVPGDVIYLHEGDVVPADARLLSSKDLVVMEETLEGDPNRRETVRLRKYAGEIPQEMPRRHSPAHMVYAGGVVLKGRAKALVTATGQRTHMGGLMGKIPCSHQNTPPATLAQARKKLSLANLIVAMVAVPLTAVGILTLGDTYGLADLFATALALSVLTLTEHMFVMGSYVSTALRQAATHEPDPHLSCEIRDTQTLEKLRHMDHLVVVGTAILHDGVFMPESILTGGNTYTCGESAVDDNVMDFAEKLFLYAEGLKSLDETLSKGMEKVTVWAQTDVEALMLRMTSLTPYRDGVEVVMQRNAPIRLYLDPVTQDHGFWDARQWVRCAKPQGGGEVIIPMDDTTKSQWMSFVKTAEQQGKRVCVLLSEDDQGLCAEGLLAFVPETCPKTKGVLSAMVAAGIAVTVFLHDTTWEDTYYLRQAGILAGRETPYHLQNQTTQDILTLAGQGVSAFDGCTTQDVVNYVQALQATGAVVGVLSVETADREALSVADIAFTCASVATKEALMKHTPIPVGDVTAMDGQPDGDTASDLCRYTADVVVRRASKHGGGVCGVRRALLAAEQMQKSGRAVCRYIFLSQILRVVMVLLPLFLGLTMMPASVILVSGFGMDLLAFWCFAKADTPTELTSRRMEKADAEKAKAQEKKPPALSEVYVKSWMVIVIGVSCLIPWTMAFVAKLLHVTFGADLGYYGTLCLLGTQVALLLCQKLPRRRRLGFFVVVGGVCVYVGALSVALAAGLFVMWSLLLPLIQPLCLFVAVKICQKIDARHGHQF